MMIRHFPFTEVFNLKMGTQPLASQQPIFECDEQYEKEIVLKNTLLAKDHSYYYRALPNTLDAQWEVLQFILIRLCKDYADRFQLTTYNDNWAWNNKWLNKSENFIVNQKNSSFYDPLDWAGRQVQEDLLILNEALELVAGQLCFASGWSLDEKIGKHFFELHGPLPDRMDAMIDAAAKVMLRIPNGKTIVRANWGLRVTDVLDLSSRHQEHYLHLLERTASQLRPQEVGDKVFLRIEHQSLTKLKDSGHILFTVKTYVHPLSQITNDSERAHTLYSYLCSVPDDVFDYKLISPFKKTLLRYFENLC